MRNFLFLFLFALASSSHAETNFNCYAYPGLPVQSYEIGSINCPGGAQGEIRKNGETSVLCIYLGACEALAPGEKATELSTEELSAIRTDPYKAINSSFKNSMVSCAGTGRMGSGILIQANCPPPSECSKDILYNANFAQSFGGIQTTIQQKNIRKKSQ